MKSIQHFNKNTQGRDWVVGDLHGRYDELMTSLGVQGFDFDTDRLFSVGDLVDRGSQSKAVVELVSEPWFCPVRGNHDQMIIDQFNESPVLKFGYKGLSPQAIHQKLEGQWFAELADTQRHWFYEALKDLPYLIEVETEHGRVGICHAGLPRYIEDWNELKTELGSRDIQEQVMRTRRAPNQERVITGIDITVHGHTCFEEIHQVENSFWIDTFDKTGRLTIMELNALFERVNLKKVIPNG